MADKTDLSAQQTEQPRPSQDSDVQLEVHKMQQIEGLKETHESIMLSNKPNQWGSGYIRLYMLAACIFLNSTMNGWLLDLAYTRDNALIIEQDLTRH
jgi:hypothetical protein